MADALLPLLAGAASFRNPQARVPESLANLVLLERERARGEQWKQEFGLRQREAEERRAERGERGEERKQEFGLRQREAEERTTERERAEKRRLAMEEGFRALPQLQPTMRTIPGETIPIPLGGSLTELPGLPPFAQEDVALQQPPVRFPQPLTASQAATLAAGLPISPEAMAFFQQHIAESPKYPQVAPEPSGEIQRELRGRSLERTLIERGQPGRTARVLGDLARQGVPGMEVFLSDVLRPARTTIDAGNSVVVIDNDGRVINTVAKDPPYRQPIAREVVDNKGVMRTILIDPVTGSPRVVTPRIDGKPIMARERTTADKRIFDLSRRAQGLETADMDPEVRALTTEQAKRSLEDQIRADWRTRLFGQESGETPRSPQAEADAYLGKTR